ncbi:cation diffusion facilitator family transporter [Cognatilysobacter lacus]|uniref:Cation transporter n=1 Tax=Cognatilysobacter lacus TaxID=1643323 RepID=A0A5D8Z915_9GAMM|nr:cation diffusion facilitator family transporter [Lysobacter lacus]TZF91425.1 cation transporter [Lysobacter lacus]
MASSGNKVVIAALIGNLAVSVTKFVAASMTGSSAMLSEGVHSLVDTSNELLMLYGMRRASRPVDVAHPFGHGRELYFWAFIVALLVFALGASVSMYEGVGQLRHPEPVERPVVNYLVLAASMVFEGVSWTIAMREFRRAKGSLGWFEAFRQSKDPTTFTVLFEDTAALAGLVVALCGIGLAQLTGNPRWDGGASVVISLLLAFTALLLVRETKALLLGESAGDAVRTEILRIAGADPGVRCANGVITQQFGPETVVAALSADFHDAMTTTEIEDCIRRIEAGVQKANPEVVALFVKPQTAEIWQQRTLRARRGEAPSAAAK